MKKLFLSLVVGMLALVSTESFAQYQKGDKLLNAGIGLGSYYGYYGGRTGIPLGASLEFGITDQISVGAQVDFYSIRYSFGRYTYLPIAVRGSYHVNELLNQLLNFEVDNLDLYGGAGIGYSIANYSDRSGVSVNAYDGGIFPLVFVGGRYYFKENLGAFAELGYNVAPLRIGVALKF